MQVEFEDNRWNWTFACTVSLGGGLHSLSALDLTAAAICYDVQADNKLQQRILASVKCELNTYTKWNVWSEKQIITRRLKTVRRHMMPSPPHVRNGLPSKNTIASSTHSLKRHKYHLIPTNQTKTSAVAERPRYAPYVSSKIIVLFQHRIMACRWDLY